MSGDRGGKTIELHAERTWPADVLARLTAALPTLRAYENRRRQIDRLCERDVGARWDPPANEHAPARDDLFSWVDARLASADVLGFHATRLHADEVSDVLRNGLRPLAVDVLRTRVLARQAVGDFAPEVADRLLAAHYADATNRRGMIWFVFTPALLREEAGMYRLFTYWGGEALYIRHEDDVATAGVLHGTGYPCIVEAVVPIAGLQIYSRFSEDLVARYLHHRRLRSRNGPDVSGHVRSAVPGSAVRRVIVGSEPEFERLTRVRSWRSDPRR